MKITFEKIRVPNFVITDKGKFSLAELSEEEFLDYVNLTRLELKNNRLRQMRTTLEIDRR